MAGNERAAAGLQAGVTTAIAAGSAAGLSESISEMVGDPETEHVEFATRLRRSVPELLYDAAHSQELAYLLTSATGGAARAVFSAPST